jgi:patatin-like phospholipase/acyl hydrolase
MVYTLTLDKDGGGIRGLSELIILEEIMARITNDERQNGKDVSKPLRPCDYFDLITGTSTGGCVTRSKVNHFISD